MENKNFEKISLQDWRKYALGEGSQGYKSDEFYSALANDLYEILRPACGVGILPSEDMHILCVRLSQYVEDAVSGLGIFQAFRELNQSFDQRPLPFYDVNMEGSEEETLCGGAIKKSKESSSKFELYNSKKINVSDIKLLLWDFVMTFNTKKEIPSPFNPDYDRIARELKVIMDDAFRSAPKNEELYQWLYPTEKFSGYADLKDRLIWLNRGCFLTASYSYDSELSGVMDQISRIWIEEGMEEGVVYRALTKATPKQNTELFTDFLIFDKTTRLLSLPFHKFYAQMLKNNVHDAVATLVGEIGATFQIFKVQMDEQGNCHFFTTNGEDYIGEISDSSTNKNTNPEDIMYLLGCIVRFSDKWHLCCGIKLSSKEDNNFAAMEAKWEKLVQEWQKMKEDSSQAYGMIFEMQKDKILGFYSNYPVCYALMLESGCLKVVENSRKIIESQSKLIERTKYILDLEEELNQLRSQDKENGLNMSEELQDIKENSGPITEDDLKELQDGLRHYRRELKKAEKELAEAQKQVFKFKVGFPVNPIVVVVHMDKHFTDYNDYVSELDISSNPYACPSKRPKESVEYVILNHFDYDLAKTVLKDRSLLVSKQNISPNMKRVRRFVVENAEFISRYCYHDCFCGLLGVDYKYPKGRLFEE